MHDFSLSESQLDEDTHNPVHHAGSGSGMRVLFFVREPPDFECQGYYTSESSGMRT